MAPGRELSASVNGARVGSGYLMAAGNPGGLTRARTRPVARENLFLPNLTRGVFGVAGSLLILFEGGIGLGLGGSLCIPFGILPHPFVDDGQCLPSVLGRARRLSLLSAHSVGVLSSRRANLARRRRFHLCSLPL